MTSRDICLKSLNSLIHYLLYSLLKKYIFWKALSRNFKKHFSFDKMALLKARLDFGAEGGLVFLFFKMLFFITLQSLFSFSLWHRVAKSIEVENNCQNICSVSYGHWSAFLHLYLCSSRRVGPSWKLALYLWNPVSKVCSLIKRDQVSTGGNISKF